MATPMGYESSRAREQTYASAATTATAVGFLTRCARVGNAYMFIIYLYMCNI